MTILDISGTELRRRLQEGLEIPDWFSFPAVVAGAPQVEAAAREPGLHRLLHRALGLGQVDDRQRADDQADGDGRAAGDAAGRRRGAQAPVLASSDSPRNTGTSTSSASASSPRRSPRTAASPSARRSRPTRRTRAIVREMIESYGAFVEVHVVDLARGVRAARPQGALQAGARGQDQGVHRHLRPLRGAEDPGAEARHREPRRRLLRAAGDPEAREHGADPGLIGRGSEPENPADAGRRGFSFVSEINGVSLDAHIMHNACTRRMRGRAPGAKG